MKTVLAVDSFVLLLLLGNLLGVLGEHIVLNESLFEQAAQPKALVSVVLHLVRGLFVLTHLDILL